MNVIDILKEGGVVDSEVIRPLEMNVFNKFLDWLGFERRFKCVLCGKRDLPESLMGYGHWSSGGPYASYVTEGFHLDCLLNEHCVNQHGEYFRGWLVDWAKRKVKAEENREKTRTTLLKEIKNGGLLR